MSRDAYDGLSSYFGDLHSHCAIGYGHGSIEDAYQNARLQLDFACVTPHAYWPDMPEGNERLARVVAYHRQGFEHSRLEWEHARAVVETNNAPGRFVSFLGFEWHSLEYGDHHVVWREPRGEIIRATRLADMRRELREYARQDCHGLLIPHHIGYRQGYRGIQWAAFDPEFSPVAEIMSMHGAAESDDAPYPYLHTMGPRDGKSTLQYGLAQGHIVGAVGSTDHHSAHPGSYGHGRAGVWARALTREGIWEAIQARRTIALTGDRIQVKFSIDGQPMGSVLPPTPERHVAIEITGGDELDYVELLHNNRVVKRWDATGRDVARPSDREPVKVNLEMGWGERNQIVDWQGSLEVIEGELLSVEPRFRGHEVVAPQESDPDQFVFSQWERQGSNRVSLRTRTWGNPTTTTASTQGLCLEIMGNAKTRIGANINGRVQEVALEELRKGSRAEYLGGFLAPAFSFHRAVPYSAYHCKMRWAHRVHQAEGDSRDWYYVRVRQKNNQYAWTSPIWV